MGIKENNHVLRNNLRLFYNGKHRRKFKKNTFKTKTKVLHLFTRNLKVHDCYFVYINTRKLLL